MKYLSIDTESTGINSKTCDLLEFGALLDDLSNLLPIDQLPKFHCYFLPPESGVFTGEPTALSMHPTIFKRIAEREAPYNYFSTNRFGYQFKKFLLDNGFKSEDDRVTINVAGKNVAWDINFLEDKTDIKKHIKMRHRVLDPGILYLQKDDDRIPGLEECKKRAGIVETRVNHNAIDDAIDVILLLRCRLSHVYKR